MNGSEGTMKLARVCGVVLVIVSLYVLSIGPVTWVGDKYYPGWIRSDAVFTFYSPVLWLLKESPKPVGDFLWWYMQLWQPRFYSSPE
ncbi:MAG: hypothetical protein QOE70_3571 [Chthoniobacter sp.]|jgi:hypothetical protein|nr:hypothetical protein [Chthoniobacter sp.]